MTSRQIIVAGLKVDVHNFGYAAFYYPAFNGNAEFKVSSKGFRQLSHYLRTVKYFRALVDESFNISKNEQQH